MPRGPFTAFQAKRAASDRSGVAVAAKYRSQIAFGAAPSPKVSSLRAIQFIDEQRRRRTTM
ncbi:hypothetical protein ACFWPH_33415 [Nocardia sp. NPDC058499]|uniref:hypothetical protein n=1 Tax=Nocardia sp. NPDC058499 TaxID=3346530 RepID=UPI0036622863